MSILIDAVRKYDPFGEGKKQAGRKDVLINEKQVAAHNSGVDVRMYMDAESLEKLLVIAKSSGVQRVQLDNVGLHIKRYRSPEGHVYECWSILSGNPKAERVPLLESLTNTDK